MDHAVHLLWYENVLFLPSKLRRRAWNSRVEAATSIPQSERKDHQGVLILPWAFSLQMPTRNQSQILSEEWSSGLPPCGQVQSPLTPALKASLIVNRTFPAEHTPSTNATQIFWECDARKWADVMETSVLTHFDCYVSGICISFRVYANSISG